jgi:hypothetical protein
MSGTCDIFSCKWEFTSDFCDTLYEIYSVASGSLLEIFVILCSVGA